MARSAVITADIVNSTKLSKPLMKKLMKEFATVFAPNQLEFFRGDSFQVLVKSAEDALAILLKARTIAMLTTAESEAASDIRCCLAIGEVKFPVKELNTATSEAFVLSGRSFDNMPKDKRLLLISAEKNTAVNAGLQVISSFIDYLFEQMTAKQAMVVYEMLQGRSQTEAAKKIKKTQVTVHKHLQAAGWPQLEQLLADYKKFISLIEP